MKKKSYSSPAMQTVGLPADDLLTISAGDTLDFDSAPDAGFGIYKWLD